jgi:hypothetical protein
MRAVGSVGISHAAAGIVVNHLAFLLALAGVYRIAARHSSAAAARLAVWSLALFPLSFLFSMIYPSSIFLAASVWAFLLVEDQRDLAAGAVAVAATLVRPNGAVVALALAFAVGFAWRRVLLACVPSAIALLGWGAYNLDRTDNALTFYHAKSGWVEIDLVSFLHHFQSGVLPHVLLAGASVAALILVWRNLPRSWLVFAALYLLPSFYVGMIGIGRYANECFPVFAATGQVLSGWQTRTRAAFFAVCVALQVVCAYAVIHVVHNQWVP